MTDRTDIADAQRWIVLACVALVPLVRLKSFNDAFSLPKALLILALALALVATALPLVPRFVRNLGRPTPFVAAVGVWIFGVVLSAVFADSTRMALLGPYRRWNGALLYVAVGAVALTVVVRARLIDVDWILRIVGVTAGVVAVHAVLQRFELVDPGLSTSGTRRIVATLGNPNFVAAYLAIGLPAIVRQVFRERSAGVRAAWATVGLVALFAILLTQSLQGLAATGAAALAGGSIWAWHARPAVGRALLGIGAAAGVLGSLGFAGVGPAGFLAAERTFELRTYYWGAALRMLSDSPVVGVGTGRYIAHFRQVRSLEATQALPINVEVDGAHNVVLDAFGTGGLITGVALTAVLAITAVGLIRALGRDGQHAGLLAAVGAAWAAYVVQAMVSLDTPSLLLLGWVLTAAVVATARHVEMDAPAAEAAEGRRTKSKKARAAERKAARVPAWRRGLPGLPSTATLGRAFGAVALVGVAGVPIAAAERSASVARAATLASAGPAAVENSEAAVASVPWLPHHWILVGVARASTNDHEGAVTAYQRATDIDPGLLQPVTGIAEEAGRIGDFDMALAAYERAVEIDPKQASLYVAAGLVALDARGGEAGEQWARRALRVDDTVGDSWALLGRSLHAEGDVDAAFEALERAEALGTEDSVALELLHQLRS